MQFHPRSPLLITGSSDSTIKLFDYSKPAVKRSFRFIQVRTSMSNYALQSLQEVQPIQCLSIHPAGEYMMVGVRQHPTLRLYNVNTNQCFTGVQPQEQHKNAVNDVSVDGGWFIAGDEIIESYW